MMSFAEYVRNRDLKESREYVNPLSGGVEELGSRIVPSGVSLHQSIAPPTHDISAHTASAHHQAVDSPLHQTFGLTSYSVLPTDIKKAIGDPKYQTKTPAIAPPHSGIGSAPKITISKTPSEGNKVVDRQQQNRKQATEMSRRAAKLDKMIRRQDQQSSHLSQPQVPHAVSTIPQLQQAQQQIQQTGRSGGGSPEMPVIHHSTDKVKTPSGNRHTSALDQAFIDLGRGPQTHSPVLTAFNPLISLSLRNALSGEEEEDAKSNNNLKRPQ